MDHSDHIIVASLGLIEDFPDAVEGLCRQLSVPLKGWLLLITHKDLRTPVRDDWVESAAATIPSRIHSSGFLHSLYRMGR